MLIKQGSARDYGSLCQKNHAGDQAYHERAANYLHHITGRRNRSAETSCFYVLAEKRGESGHQYSQYHHQHNVGDKVVKQISPRVFIIPTVISGEACYLHPVFKRPCRFSACLRRIIASGYIKPCRRYISIYAAFSEHFRGASRYYLRG